MRVAALAFGVLAGLVASLILALGGLDVGADLAGADRQSQAIRFGLLLIGNLGVFGAALVLASPLAGAIVLLVGALAWIGAALFTHHTTDFVLITPPALLLVSAVLAGIAHIRRPAKDEDGEPDVEIIAPDRARSDQRRPSDMMGEDEEEEMGLPAFAAEAQPAPSRDFEDDRLGPQGDNWNPRRRQPPPPRTKPAFRPIEEEYDDEPSGFSRFALGLSSVLSFGLYAALAGAAMLVMWNLRDSGSRPPAAVVAEAPDSSASSSSEARALSLPATPNLSSEPTTAPNLAPTLTAEADASRETTAPSLSPSSPEATSPALAVSAPQSEGFGEVTFGPDGLPTLSDSFDGAPGAVSSLEPPTAATEPSGEPQVASTEPVVTTSGSAQVASVPAAGQPFPRLGSVQMAALRQSASPGVTTVARPTPQANNTGL